MNVLPLKKTSFAALFFLFVFSFPASSSCAAQMRQDIRISDPVSPKDTARYYMEFSTISGAAGMSTQRVMRLDARGLPATATPNKAWHMIPEGMKMGKALVLIRPESRVEGEDTPDASEAGRENRTTKIYWGCAKEVPKGQPIILSTKDKTGNSKIFNAYEGGDAARMWNAPPKNWGWGQWPNRESYEQTQVPENASLRGDHFLHGNYLPHIKFTISRHDFLEQLNVKTGDGNLKTFIPLSWNGVTDAIGYFFFATAVNQEKKETVIWTSSQKATYGIQSFEYSKRIKELVKLGVVLEPETRECNIPAGIFDGYENPMIMGHAWGEDYRMSYPPTSANAPKNQKPDWTVTGLFHTQWMGVLGVEMSEVSFGSYKNDKSGDDSLSETPAKKSESGKKNEKGGAKININFPVSIPRRF